MNTEDMRKIIESTQVGDTLLVKAAGGRPTRYTVRKIGGKKARQLSLDGRRGAMRVLVDGGDQVWIREASARASDGTAHRRVMSLRNCTTSPNEKQPSDQPRSTSAILREMAIREAGLPPGYGIELHPRGFQAFADGEPAGQVHASAYVAVCAAWSHWARSKDVLAAERWALITKNALTEERLLLDLPHGYVIDPGDPGFYRAEHDDTRWAGVVRTSAAEAVVDALVHNAQRLADVAAREATDKMIEKRRAELLAEGEEQKRKYDAASSRALQQIAELLEGKPRSGKQFEGEPEQVVADVAHRLLVQRRREDIVEIKTSLGSMDADRIEALMRAASHLWAVAS